MFLDARFAEGRCKFTLFNNSSNFKVREFLIYVQIFPQRVLKQKRILGYDLDVTTKNIKWDF